MCRDFFSLLITELTITRSRVVSKGKSILGALSDRYAAACTAGS